MHDMIRRMVQSALPTGYSLDKIEAEVADGDEDGTRKVISARSECERWTSLGIHQHAESHSAAAGADAVRYAMALRKFWDAGRAERLRASDPHKYSVVADWVRGDTPDERIVSELKVSRKDVIAVRKAESVNA
jgi:hypothetical protein